MSRDIVITTILVLLGLVFVVRIWRSRQLPASLRPGAWSLTAGVGFITLTFATAYVLRPGLNALTPRLSELSFRVTALLAGGCLLMHLNYRTARTSVRRLVVMLTSLALTIATLTVLWVLGPRFPQGGVDGSWPESPEANQIVKAFVITFDLAMLAWVVQVGVHCARSAAQAYTHRHRQASGLAVAPVVAGQGLMAIAAAVMGATVTITILRALGLPDLGDFGAVVLPLAAFVLGCLGVLMPVAAAVAQSRSRIRALSKLASVIEAASDREDPRRASDPGYTLRVLRLRIHDALETIDLCDDAAMRVATSSDPTETLGAVLADQHQWHHVPSGETPSWPALTYLPEVHSESAQLVQQLVLANGLQKALEVTPV